MDRLEEQIAEAINEIHIKCKNILEAWCEECKIDEPIAYDLSLSNKVLTIYTRKPGIMIGLNGRHVDKYKDMFNKEFLSEFRVEFTEVRGEFVNYYNPRPEGTLVSMISVYDYQVMLLDFINSDEFNNNIANTAYADSSDFRQGFMHGLSMAGLLTCKVNNYIMGIIDEEEKK